eukprot:6814491-Alexandrium_andersonii.AAC.1
MGHTPAADLTEQAPCTVHRQDSRGATMLNASRQVGDASVGPQDHQIGRGSERRAEAGLGCGGEGR